MALIDRIVTGLLTIVREVGRCVVVKVVAFMFFLCCLVPVNIVVRCEYVVKHFVNYEHNLQDIIGVGSYMRGE